MKTPTPRRKRKAKKAREFVISPGFGVAERENGVLFILDIRSLKEEIHVREVLKKRRKRK